jgi:phage gpG-like protein
MDGFNIQVAGMAELRARLNAMKDRAANPGPGLLRAGMVVIAATKDHIKSGAGDQGSWPPNITGTPLLFKTGRLINSITANVVSNDTVEVGTNVFYARWLQEGTGIYGPTGQRIFPKTKKALAWDGHVVRSIKGTPPRRYLYIDDAQATKIRDVFASFIVNGLSS